MEANLQALVDAQIAPLEEGLKVLLVDIVRRCQSTIAQNYVRINKAHGGEATFSPTRLSTSTDNVETDHTLLELQALDKRIGSATENASRQDPNHAFPLLNTSETQTIPEPYLPDPSNLDSDLDDGWSFLLFCECPSNQVGNLDCRCCPRNAV